MVIMMITFVIQITINMININGDDHDDEERYDDDHVDSCAIYKGWHWEGLMIIMIMITNPWLIWCSLWWWWWLWDQEGLTGGREAQNAAGLFSVSHSWYTRAQSFDHHPFVMNILVLWWTLSGWQWCCWWWCCYQCSMNIVHDSDVITVSYNDPPIR